MAISISDTQLTKIQNTLVTLGFATNHLLDRMPPGERKKYQWKINFGVDETTGKPNNVAEPNIRMSGISLEAAKQIELIFHIAKADYVKFGMKRPAEGKPYQGIVVIKLSDLPPGGMDPFTGSNIATFINTHPDQKIRSEIFTETSPERSYKPAWRGLLRRDR